MANWSEADTKKLGGDHILTQFLILQTSNFTMPQNILNKLNSISANHEQNFPDLLFTSFTATYTCWNFSETVALPAAAHIISE